MPADIDDIKLVVDGGDAWFELGGASRTGRVLASFPRSVYVEVGGAVVALVSIDAPPGPLHLRVDPLPRPAPGSRIRVDRLVSSSARWRPPAVDATLLRRHASAAGPWLAGAARSNLAGDPAVDAAGAGLRSGDLRTVVDALAGRGAGLTPAGDDVLGGILLVLATAGHDRRELHEAVATARTHAISRAFLAWAARGQVVEPVHLLLAALATDDAVAARRHQGAVLALGHTSGADLVLGLRLGLGALQGTDQTTAGGSTRAHLGPPSPPVRSTTAARDPVRVADSMSFGSTRSSISLARLNISNSPFAPTSPHVR
jgi:hypothetical protein